MACANRGPRGGAFGIRTHREESGVSHRGEAGASDSDAGSSVALRGYFRYHWFMFMTTMVGFCVTPCNLELIADSWKYGFGNQPTGNSSAR